MRKIVIILLMCVGIVSPAFAEVQCKKFFGDRALKTPLVDEVNLPFVDDPQLIGYWVAVDFVDKPEQFNPAVKSFEDELYLRELIFLPNGRLVNSAFTWTKGHILDSVDLTNSSYEIKEINGKTYLFFQWKSGDYTCMGITPSYYVLRKDGNLRFDKVDLPFKNDKKVLGRWKTVDFVFMPEQFEPGKKFWEGDLYLKTLTFLPNGKTPMSPAITWTKGKVLHHNDKTASAYQIKKIDGKEYMFFEWKSGDYTFRGQDPAYYVLERA